MTTSATEDSLSPMLDTEPHTLPGGHPGTTGRNAMTTTVNGQSTTPPEYPILLEIDTKTFGAETTENRAFGYLDEKIAEFRGLSRRISTMMGDVAQALTIERQQIAGGYATWGDSMDTRWARLERDLERRQYVVNEINDLGFIAGLDVDALWEEILRRLSEGDWKIL